MCLKFLYTIHSLLPKTASREKYQKSTFRPLIVVLSGQWKRSHYGGSQQLPGTHAETHRH